MNKIITNIYILTLGLSMTMCKVEAPTGARAIAESPKLYPDYTDLVIPSNIAPLNFCISEKGTDFVTHLHSNADNGFCVKGKVLDIDVKKWHKLLEASAYDTIYVDVYAKANGAWYKYMPVKYYVAETIDPYLSYRHIEPLYVCYETLNICQRNLENFEIKDIYNNYGYLNSEGDRQCMNCHSYQDYNRNGNMQMHIRVTKGGTLIVRDGNIQKVNLRVGEAFSPGVYPSWHPTAPYIAYSINDTWQHFHSVDNNKVEVQDAASGLILYNVDTNTVSMISDSSTELETFPYWSADGKFLYYVSANIPEMTREEMSDYRRNNYKDIKYNIYRRSFDSATGQFGPVDSVFMASNYGLSATFPRESPDGKYMVFTLGEYGTFHNFHHDADLYIMDMQNRATKPLDLANSDDTESYHSWSSNGKWIVFSSRRDNGSFTRLYLTYFDGNGNVSKPFILPEKSPFANDLLFKSYNVPEFMVQPVNISIDDWMHAIDKDPIDANFIASTNN